MLSPLVFFREEGEGWLYASLGKELLDLRAEVSHQTDVFDDHIDDSPGALDLTQAIVDQEVISSWLNNSGLHRPVAAWFLSVAGDLNGLFVKAADVLAVRDREVFLEFLAEDLLLRFGHPLPVSSGDQSGD